MRAAVLSAGADGTFQVTGPVVFATAGALLEESHQLFVGMPALKVNLSGVTQVDSAALALLIEWLRLARRDGREVRFQSLPQQLRSIARLTGVEDIIAAAAD